MKRKTTCFFTGVLTALLVIALSATALAVDSWTIKVHPIHILVGGEVFQPKDSAGNDVQCFVVNGCTYAPLRALAEAYGLEVGYDAATNTATVDKPRQETMPEPCASPELVPLILNDFASQWAVAEKPVTNYGDEKIFTATYSGSLSMSEFKNWWKAQDLADIQREAEKMAAEHQAMMPGYPL